MRPLILFVLASCAAATPPPHVAFGRMAAAHLEACIQNNSCAFLSQCFSESEAYCVAAGYSKRCGQMEPEGSCGDRAQ